MVREAGLALGSLEWYPRALAGGQLCASFHDPSAQDLSASALCKLVLSICFRQGFLVLSKSHGSCLKSTWAAITLTDIS